MMNYFHEYRMKVRDYECDLQGIVNNANYLHFLEHARHEFLLSEGVSFAQLHYEGTDAVVANVNMRFKTPLRSGDEFIVKTAIRHEGLRLVFTQDIFRASDMKMSLKGQVDVVCLVDGVLTDCNLLDHIIAKHTANTPA